MDRRLFMTSMGSVAISGSVRAQADKGAPRANKSPQPNRLTVVAWNVACGQWCTSREVAHALADRRPDLVLLNETPKFDQGCRGT